LKNKSSNLFPALNIPGLINQQLDVKSGKFSSNFVLDPTFNSAEPTDIFLFQVKPFTTFKNSFDVTPLFIINFKPIDTKDAAKTKEISLGEMCDLDLKLRLSSEAEFNDFHSDLEIFKLFNGNLKSIFFLPLIIPTLRQSGKPSFRLHEIALGINTASTSLQKTGLEVYIEAEKNSSKHGENNLVLKGYLQSDCKAEIVQQSYLSKQNQDDYLTYLSKWNVTFEKQGSSMVKTELFWLFLKLCLMFLA